MNDQHNSAAKPSHRGYFVNAPADMLLVGGASILTFICFSLFYTELRTPEVITLSIYLAWIINWPHFSMLTYRLYQSRRNIEQYPFTALVIPFVVLGGVLLSFAYPLAVAPYFAKLFLIWSPYHFSAQTIGITMIYARRHGVTASQSLEPKEPSCHRLCSVPMYYRLYGQR
jgi:hypothetical protein